MSTTIEELLAELDLLVPVLQPYATTPPEKLPACAGFLPSLRRVVELGTEVVEQADAAWDSLFPKEEDVS